MLIMMVLRLGHKRLRAQCLHDKIICVPIGHSRTWAKSGMHFIACQKCDARSTRTRKNVV